MFLILNTLIDTFRFLRDPLVAVNEGDPELLLGYSRFDSLRLDLQLKLPFFFALLRGSPLTYDVEPTFPY